ncbi:acyl-CoA desaturase 1-like [Lineus longissimus]|uniref:acyl-CoA desaturase 1-like n=1 Tax=Lineus longissimus TaxID=88925 RepID=UPI002B4E6C3B
MAPKIREEVLNADGPDHCDLVQEAVSQPIEDPTKLPPRCRQLVWRNIILFIFLHLGSLYGIYCLFYSNYLTLLWAAVLYQIGALGVTAGAHRLWSHRTYKARLPVRIFLAMANSVSFQNDIFEWARDHRVHHKYTDSHADPHNVNRGLFFAHMGWLLVRKHPDVIAKGKALDLSDLKSDPVVMFQRRFYIPSIMLLCFTIPTIVPHLLWGESIANAYFVCALLRYTLTLHATWCVNSLAHALGMKPYDRFIKPAENMLVAFMAMGEGFHNYHHTFPQDYSTSEYGWKINSTTMFIDFMAAIGQVEGRKKISKEIVMKRKERTGAKEL